MATPNEFPIFKCIIDPKIDSELEVDFIALVDKPAIEKDFQKFNAAKLRFNIDEDKRIVSGPAMIADMLIYRNDPEGIGEYYTVFDKEAIYNIVQKFFKKGFGQNFNIMHEETAQVKDRGVTIFESFLTSEARGVKAPLGYEDVSDGSWFISAKVDDDDTWAKIKSGELKGFSVEGFFKRIPVRTTKITPDVALKQIKNLLAAIDLGE